MRMIGQLENEASARLFSDFLYAQGIENQTEPERSGAWALWIHAEEQMEAAKALLNEYRENPRDPKYQHASRVAEEKWKQEQKANAAAEKRFHDRSKLFSLGGLGVGYLTGVLVAISVVATLLSRFGANTKPILWMFISEYDVEGGVIARLAVLVLVIAALSNFGQYLWQGPIFFGMSGVVYGLVGYIWLRGKFDLTSGLFLHRNTVMMAVIWFVLCLVGVIPHVANAAHSVGFGVGIAWGFISAMF